ncbi:MAG: hypothetical protein ACREL7_10185 [Longimicrobiales bacterium]
MIRVPRWPGEPGEASNGADRVITPFAVAATLLRRWRLVTLMPLLAVAAAVALSFLTRAWTAESRFVPQSSSGDVSRFAGIAAQIGLPLNMEPSGESPDFYVDLVRSGEVLTPALEAQYAFAVEPGSPDSLRGTWLDLVDIEGETPDDRLRNGIDVLRDLVSPSASAKSGIVTVRTEAPWPGLAEALNARILQELASFDRERRQYGAHAERVFVENRLDSAKTELEQGEAALARFLDRNRRPVAPRLVMEMERLQRVVGQRQQVFAALAQAYEQARIEEVRNTPVITVIDRPEGSARSSRGVIFVVAVAFLLGLIAAIAMAFILDWLDGQRDTAGMRELRAALRRPARRIRVGGPGG